MKKWIAASIFAIMTFMGLQYSNATAEQTQSQTDHYVAVDRTMNNNGITDRRYDPTDRLTNRMNTYTNDLDNNGVNGDLDGTRAYYGNTYRTTAAADNDMDWGWLGILGLIGLAGLTGRNRDPHPEK